MREKEEALKSQQISFLNMQLQEAKIAMEENKNTHSHILQAFQQVENEKTKLNKES